MDSDPLVSISIPSYNHARWLPEAIESALSQSYPNVEVVIADDGSPDESLAIAERYAQAHPEQVRVCTHPDRVNRGISQTINLAFSQSRGSYWSMLDSDDALLPEKVEREMLLLTANADMSFVYGQAALVDGEGRRIPNLAPLGADITRQSVSLQRLFRRNPIPNLTGLARVQMIREPSLLLHRDELVYGDWDFWIRLAARGRIGFVPAILARERIHGYNVSWHNDPALDRQRNIAVLEAVRVDAEIIAGPLLEPSVRAALDVELAFRRLEDGKTAPALDSLAAAFSIDPSLAGDADRFWRLLVEISTPAIPLTSADEHLAAADWVGSGASLPAPAVVNLEANFPLWAFAHAPPVLRGGIGDRTVATQLACAAAARIEAATSGAFRLCLRALRCYPALLRERSVRRLLVRAAAGPRLHSVIRHVRNR